MANGITMEGMSMEEITSQKKTIEQEEDIFLFYNSLLSLELTQVP